MKSQIINRLFIVISCVISGVLFVIINTSAVEIQSDTIERIVPPVQVAKIRQSKHQITLTGHGIIEPLESTQLVTEVTGKITYWHPSLVPGGLVKRATLLLSIEKEAYQAAVLRAKELVAVANALLIQEQAKSNVAIQEAQGLKDSDVSELYLRRPQLQQAQFALDSALASLKVAKKNLHNCDIYAPFDGLVVSREVGQRQYVSQGQEVAMLHSIEFAEIHVPIAGFERNFLPEKIERTNAIISGNYQGSRKGHVMRGLGVVDTQTRMRHLVVRVEDPYSLSTQLPVLRFGEFVEASFPGNIIENVYQVPQRSVTNNELWLVDNNNKLQRKSVSVLSKKDNLYIVEGNLGLNATVVLTLPEYPRTGMLVNPHLQQKSIM